MSIDTMNQKVQTLFDETMEKHNLELDEMLKSSKTPTGLPFVQEKHNYYIPSIEESYKNKLLILQRKYPNRFNISNVDELSFDQAKDLYVECIENINKEKEKYSFSYEDVKTIVDHILETGLVTEPSPGGISEFISIMPSAYKPVFDRENYDKLDQTTKDEIRRNGGKIGDYTMKVIAMILSDPRTKPEEIETIKREMIPSAVLFEQIKQFECCIL